MEKTGVSLPFVSAGHFLMFQDPEAVLHFFFTADLGGEGEQGSIRIVMVSYTDRIEDLFFRAVRTDGSRAESVSDISVSLYMTREGFSFGCLYHSFLCQGFQHFSDCAHSHMVYFAELAHGRQRAL